MGIPPRWKAIAKTTLTILVATITAFGALATIFTYFGVTFEKLGPYVIPTGHPLALGAFFIGDLAVFGYVMYRIGSARLTKRAALLESRVEERDELLHDEREAHYTTRIDRDSERSGRGVAEREVARLQERLTRDGFSSSDDIQLSLMDLFPECSRSDQTWIYKSKVRVVFRNDTQETLLVSEPQWKAGADGLLAQKPFKSTFNLEGPNGWANNDWQPESLTVRVEAGKVFRVWIGFDLDIARDPQDRSSEIRRRAVQHKLGILTLTVKKSGTDHSWSQHL